MLMTLPKRKPKKTKQKPPEDVIWDRLKAPAWGMTIFASLIVAILSVDYFNHLENARLYGDIVDLVHEWQSLIGGGFAIIGAVFAGRVIALQIARAEEVERVRLEAARLLDERNTARALMAARSVMPLTLNVLSDYTTAIAKGAITVLNDAPHEGIRLMAEQLPELPSAPRAIISDLQAFIVAAPDDVGANVADMLSDLQLLSARAENIWQRTASENEVVTRWNYEDLVGRAAVLYARQAGLFAYARRETEQAPGVPLQVHLAQALQLWRVWPDIHPQCHERAEYHLKKAQDRAT